jgi:hypothetical protein
LARTALSAGTDDHASAGDAQVQAAADLLVEDLGPGQISAPGRTTAAIHEILIEHARTHNRIAYLDTADQASKATLLAAAAAVADLVGAGRAGLFGTWGVAPGIVPRTTRNVPGSAHAAGLTARAEFEFGNPAAVPAGDAVPADYLLDIRVPAGGFTDADYTELNAAGINMTRSFRNRGIQLYGYRSVSSEPEWQQLQWARELASLTARLGAITQGYTFRTIDGKGKVFADLKGELKGECMKDFNRDALYGETSDEAFQIITDESVNTPTTIAAGEIHAQARVKISPFGEGVFLDIVKVPQDAAV